jgi:hypothetical protein
LAIFNAVGVALAVLVETGEIYFDYFYSPSMSVAGQFEWGEDWAYGVAVSAGDVTLLKNDVPVELGVSYVPGELSLTGVGVGYETAGLVSEVLAFDRVLSAGERASLQTYFNERYGL